MKIISIFLILFSLGLGSSEIVDDLFDDGNNSMVSERYEDAIQTYESILALGYQSGELFYNLGNAYYRNDNLGQAIWAYSKAQYILPRNINIKHNLEVSMAQKIDRIDMPKPFFLLKFLRLCFLKIRTFRSLSCLIISKFTFASLILGFPRL